MSLPEVLKTALDQIQYIAKTETIFGDPIEAGEVTLIPVSRVSIGFAAGGTDNEKKSGSGAGTGGGVQVTPVAFISITGEKIQIHPLEKSESGLNKIIAMAPDAIKKVSKILEKKDKKKNPPHDKENDEKNNTV